MFMPQFVTMKGLGWLESFLYRLFWRPPAPGPAAVPSALPASTVTKRAHLDNNFEGRTLTLADSYNLYIFVSTIFPVSPSIP